MSVQTRIPTLTDLQMQRGEVIRVMETYGIANVRVFGSVVRGEAQMSSDIDLLVDLPPYFSLLNLSSLVQDLQDLLGFRVEITSAAHLRDELKATILQDAQPL